MTAAERQLLHYAIVVVACGVAAFLLMLAALLSTANATTIIVPQDEHLTEQADAVVEGTIGDVRVRRRGAGVETLSALEVSDVLKGDLRPGQRLTLRTPGGTLDGVVEHYGGVESYQLGQRVIVFLEQDGDRVFHSLHLAAGTWTVSGDGQQASRAIEGAVTIRPGALTRGRIEQRGAAAFRESIRERVRRQPRPRPIESPATMPTGAVMTEPFQLFNNVRWFEPDSGQIVHYRVSTTGDVTIGAPEAILSVSRALLAWSDVPTTALRLEGAATEPILTGGCDGKSTIRFDDPGNEIDPPAGCAGVLALGGYCAGSESTVVNGTTFRRIREGDIVFADGWGPCGLWTAENLAEVATHELGHTIGLAHSEVQDATMSAYAHFDGRGASLRQDDVNAVTFVYPAAGGSPLPTATRTPTPLPTPTATATPGAPLVVAIVTDFDAYLPRDRALVTVRGNIRRARFSATILRAGLPVWTRSSKLPRSGIRRWYYRIPRNTEPYERFRLTVHAEHGGQTADAESQFQVAPPPPYSPGCDGG